jgi:hypothetical protein
VIGGPGAFTMTIKDREKVQEAIRTKLVLEVAGLTPQRRSQPRTNTLVDRSYHDRSQRHAPAFGGAQRSFLVLRDILRCRATSVANGA